MVKQNIKQGALLILIAATSYAVMGALVKLGKGAPDALLVFMRNAICLLILLPFLFFPVRTSLRTEHWITHTVRAAAGLLNMYCFFFSIRFILLADAMLLNNTMPLFVPIVAWIWKRKKISLHLVPGLLLGFLGVLFILHPERGIFHLGAFFALASGIFMSISMTGIRELSRSEPIYRILFYYFAVSTFISALPLFWMWETVNPLLWLLLIGVGVFAAIYQFFLTKAYEKASASVISPLIYFAVILSALFDWIFWKKTPDWLSAIGLLCVCVGAIWCIKAEGKT